MDMMNWERMVALVREAFMEGLMAEEALCQAMVLIPKGKGDYRGIGFVEVMWKVVAAILNIRITSSITYHYFLHGFWESCGTVTTTLDVKPLNQLVALGEEVLHMIFLDLHKVYDALDRLGCLEVIEVYGVGTRSCRCLRTYWGQTRMVARAVDYYM